MGPGFIKYFPILYINKIQPLSSKKRWKGAQEQESCIVDWRKRTVLLLLGLIGSSGAEPITEPTAEAPHLRAHTHTQKSRFREMKKKILSLTFYTASLILSFLLVNEFVNI